MGRISSYWGLKRLPKKELVPFRGGVVRTLFVFRDKDWEQERELCWWVVGNLSSIEILSKTIRQFSFRRTQLPIIVFPLSEEEFRFRGSRICLNAHRLFRAGKMPEWTACGLAVRVPQKPNLGLAIALENAQKKWDEWCRHRYLYLNGAKTPWDGERNDEWLHLFLARHGGCGVPLFPHVVSRAPLF